MLDCNFKCIYRAVIQGQPPYVLSYEKRLSKISFFRGLIQVFCNFRLTNLGIHKKNPRTESNRKGQFWKI